MINTKGLPIKTDIADIDQYPGEIFTQLRRTGLGGSDASVVIGLNPYPHGANQSQKERDLVASKVRTEITAEELAVGQNRNVRAGTELEPLIIEKFDSYFPEFKIFKPSDMYRFREFPYMTMNFDGVGYNPDGSGYIPIEIKFISLYGGKYYDFTKANWTETNGMLPERSNLLDVSTTTKIRAESVGVPQYYYPQVQQEMAALNAPYGFLAAFDEKTWELVVFKVDFDAMCFSEIVTKGAFIWERVEYERAKLGLTAADYGLKAALKSAHGSSGSYPLAEDV